MATFKDSSKEIVDLLISEWTDTNTDTNTPIIKKIFKQSKEIDFAVNKDYILIFTQTTINKESGLGNNTFEDVFETLTIDVRSSNDQMRDTDLSDDLHFNKLIAEIDRILKVNKLNFSVNYNEIKSLQQWQDLNDRNRGIFRKVKTIELVSFCRDFS